MRFIITARNDPDRPDKPEGDFDPALFEAYMRFNEEMYRAGVLVASEGLNPAARGGHVRIKDGKRIAVDGPYAESKELVGGFYLIEVPTLQDALDWAARAPHGMGSDDILEVRPLTAYSDIPPALCALIEKVAPSWSKSFRKG